MCDVLNFPITHRPAEPTEPAEPTTYDVLLDMMVEAVKAIEDANVCSPQNLLHHAQRKVDREKARLSGDDLVRRARRRGMTLLPASSTTFEIEVHHEDWSPEFTSVEHAAYYYLYDEHHPDREDD